jgi:hypothetical protein
MNHDTTHSRRLISTAVLLAVMFFLMLGITSNASAYDANGNNSHNALAAATATKTPIKAKATRTPIATEETGESINATEEATQVTIDTNGDAEAVIQSLRDQGLIPDKPEGSRLFNFVPNTFTKISTTGFTYLPIGYGKKAAEFVLNVEVGWAKAGKISGCGVGFWQAANNDYAFAMLTQDGLVASGQFVKGKNVFIYAETSDTFDPTENNVLTLVVLQDSVAIFVNGKLVTTQQGQGKAGKFSTMVFNDKGNTTVTSCTYPSGWVWTLDQ